MVEKCSNGYCEIPGGTFQMGSTNGDPDETPVRTVTMTAGFELGQTEVSVGEYRAYLLETAMTQLRAVISGCGTLGTIMTITANRGETIDQLLRRRAVQLVTSESCNMNNATQFIQSTPAGIPDFGLNRKGDSYPVVGLTFDEKRAYCRAQDSDLPTAAELHFASQFDEQDIAPDQLVIWDNGFHTTEPVDAGQRKNRWGVSDLLGNVWESALDAYDLHFYARMGSIDPYNPLTNQNTQFEELSGGSFGSVRWGARAANRDVDSPDFRLYSGGFRCARPLPHDSKK